MRVPPRLIAPPDAAGAGVGAGFAATVATAAGAGAVVAAAGGGGAAVVAAGGGAGGWGAAGAQADSSDRPVASTLPTTNCRRVSLGRIRSDIHLPPLSRGSRPLARPAYTPRSHAVFQSAVAARRTSSRLVSTAGPSSAWQHPARPQKRRAPRRGAPLGVADA